MEPRAVTLFGISIWREKAGVIGDTPCWCASYGSWLHVCGSPGELLWSVATDWKSDRHLVG